MNARDEKLAGLWIGEIILDGKPLKPLSIGRIQKLQMMKNRCFVENSEQSEIEAMIEVIYVMANDAQDVISYGRKTPQERSEILSDFSILHENEIHEVIAKVLQEVATIEAAKMESMKSGKEMRHV